MKNAYYSHLSTLIVHARYMLLCTHAGMNCSENWCACLNLHIDHFPIGATESDRPQEIGLRAVVRRILHGTVTGVPSNLLLSGVHLPLSPSLITTGGSAILTFLVRLQVLDAVWAFLWEGGGGSGVRLVASSLTLHRRILCGDLQA